MKYVTPEDITKYLKWQPATDLPMEERLAVMANYFASGAVTVVGNIMLKYQLANELAEGCRCGSCYEWVMREEDWEDNPIAVDRAETLQELVERHRNV
jgi:hypothetical protein